LDFLEEKYLQTVCCQLGLTRNERKFRYAKSREAGLQRCGGGATEVIRVLRIASGPSTI